jgi:hypothetical protein
VTYPDDIVLTPRHDSPSWVRIFWAGPAAVVPSASRRLVVTVLMVIGAATIAWSGYVHLKLWNMDNGFEQLPVVGKMFLYQGIGCLILALAAVILRRLVVAVLGALLMASSIGAVAISIRGTLFGYHEYTDAPYVTSSIVVESVSLASFAAAVIVAITAPRPSD